MADNLINIDDKKIDIEDINFWTNKQDNTVHAIIDFNGKKTRLRAGLIIIKNGNEILLGEEKDEPGVFSLPGGSIEEGETPAEAAKREAEEEVRIVAKNIRETGHDYCECNDAPAEWVEENVPKKYWWYNYYTCLCIGEYDKEFEGKIDKADKDPNMMNTSKFYPIKEVLNDKSFKIQWKKALFDAGYIKRKPVKEELDKDQMQSAEKLYHVTKYKLTHTMHPEVPKSNYEEQKTPRICFAKTIQGCLIGAYEDDDLTSQTFHVYSTVSEYYQPTNKEVFDVEATGEVWVLHDVDPEYEYDIHIIGKTGSKKYVFGEDEFDVPTWNYEIIKPIKEEYIDEYKRIYTTTSAIDIKNRIKSASNMFALIAYDRLIRRYFMYATTDNGYLESTHTDMIMKASEIGYYDKKFTDINKAQDYLTQYVDCFRFCTNSSAKYLPFCEGFKDRYIYDFGGIIFRDMSDYGGPKVIYDNTELAYVLGKYKEHYTQAFGWDYEGELVEEYDPPYNEEEVKQHYGEKVYQKLMNDPVHKWRMKTGIELIHQEPTLQELNRIWKNWQQMTDEQKTISDNMSLELFGEYNEDHYYDLLPLYEHPLDESLLKEDTRNQLVANSRNAGQYKNTKYGKNRFERKKYSKVANQVKSYNQIDMNQFFKQDILDVKVPVTGETDEYIVTVRLTGVCAEIGKNVKSNGDKFEFKCVIQALTKIFNTTDVRVNCTCDDFLYRFDHWSVVNNYGTTDSAHDPGPGKGIANPLNDKGKGCKHVLLVLNNGDWLMKVASCISNYIHWMEQNKRQLFLKFIFPKLYGIPASAAEEENLVPEDTNMDTSKDLIDLINNWAKNRGKYTAGTNKNPVTGTGGRQKQQPAATNSNQQQQEKEDTKEDKK